MSEPKPVIPPEVDWPVRAIGELVSLLRRGTAPVYTDESDVMAIGQRCITDTEFDCSRARPHSSTAMSKVLTPESDDVLINSTGTGTIGRSVVFRDDGTEYMVDGHVTVARPREADLVGRWLNDILRSPEGQRYLEARCYAGSTNQIELSSSALASVPIAIPPVNEQRRIAEVLDTLDEQIRVTEQIVVKLKLAKRGLLRDLLSRGVDRSGQLRDPSLKKGQFEETALGLLPRDWRIAICADLSRDIVVGIVIRPTQYYRSTGIPILRSANVRESGLELNDLVYMSPADHAAMSKSAVKPGDLVTVRTGYPGTTAVVHDSLPAANCVDIIITRPGPQVRSDYLARWINSDFGKGQVLRAQGGLAQQHFNVSEMQTLLVAVPPLAEQALIADRAAAADQRLMDEAQTLTKLTALKRGLIADLLSGRVRVPPEAA